MARNPTVLAPETLNHVTQRATDRELFCFDLLDRDAIVATVARTVDRYELKLVDYCVMTNHVHLMLSAPEGNLPVAMQYLWARVVERFNRRHSRRGHLVQAPYCARPVESEEHYLSARAYVAMNPVKAGLCETPEEWAWSGYGSRDMLVPAPELPVRRLVAAQLVDRMRRKDGQPSAAPAYPYDMSYADAFVS